MLAELNPEQLAAVTYGDGPLLIVAGAGTGKTATLVHRVAHLIGRGADPRRILLLTFTRRAAAEMLRRVDALLAAAAGGGGRAGERVWGGTFHAVAARLLRVHARDLGLEPDFTILDRGDAEDLLHVARTTLELGRERRTLPAEVDLPRHLLALRQRADSRCPRCWPRPFPGANRPHEGLGRLFARYTDAKEEQQVLDYDDLLLFWRGLLADPAAGARVRERFDHVLVDEYQDTNALQADIVALLRPGGAGVTCVGDDAQAIYGFRAATVRNILDFEQRFPGAGCSRSSATTARRRPSWPPPTPSSPRPPSAATRRSGPSATGGGRPLLVTCRDEDEQTALARATASSSTASRAPPSRARPCCSAPSTTRWPSSWSSRGATCRSASTAGCASSRRRTSKTSWRSCASPRTRATPWPGCACSASSPASVPPRRRRSLEALAAGGGDFAVWAAAERRPRPARGVWPASSSCSRPGRQPAPATCRPRCTPCARVYGPCSSAATTTRRRGCATSSRSRRSPAGPATAPQFLADLVLDPPAYTQELAGPPLLDEDYLILSTMHSAKGLEFDVVYVMHAADGNIPSDMATGSADEIEEERRLFYVACTRARDQLYVTHPLRYYTQPWAKADTHGYAQRSRFLDRRRAGALRAGTAVTRP